MEKNNLLIYLRESSKNTGIYYLDHDIPVWTEDPLPDFIDLNQVLKDVKRIIPSFYLRYVMAVRIGMFEEMIERQINAMYKDGVLYISNVQNNNEDMLDDIIHEIAHAVEEHNSELIYQDERLMVEFLGKRKRLFSLLKNEGYNVNIEQFMNTKYNFDFDMFLFQEVGYPILETLTMGLFLSPYSITSINEYFGVGFEQFYLEEANYIAKICPVLYQKINYLDELTMDYML